MLFMLAIKKARKLIQAQPEAQNALIFARLVLALQNDTPFQLSELYSLEPKNFALALQILHEWTVDRHYAKKHRLVDVVVKLQDVGQGSTHPINNGVDESKPVH